MTARRRNVRRLAAAALVVGAVFLFSGCALFDSPQNTFAPHGEVAAKQRDLFFIVMWPALAIMIGVFGVLLYSLWRFRQRSENEPPPVQVHGNTRLEVAWTIVPVILLAVIAVPTLADIVELGRQPRDDALHVKVMGRQWKWQFEYPDQTDATGAPVLVFDELHIPVGREVGFTVESADVIHSFWMPQLGGKIDVIPGRTNHIWIKADEPGNYSSQCAEFCGLGHSAMRFRAIAESEQDFEAWIAGGGQTSPTGISAAGGE